MPLSHAECVERVGDLRSTGSALERAERHGARGAGAVHGVRGACGVLGRALECPECMKYADCVDRAEPTK